MNRKNTLLEDLKNLQMMFDVMGDYLFVLDTEGCIQHANPTILQDLGYAEETLLGKHLRDLHPPDRREEVEESITAMLASEGDRYTIPLLTANDTLLDVETRARVGQWQGQPALIVVSRSMATPNQKCDVTVQKQAEIEQERFATRLNTAAEIAEQIGAILDVETLLKTVIPLIKERFGLYYVHVYTLNEDAGVLSLRAGYGEPGRIMVEQGHHIPLDRRQSLVATAARTKDVVLVNDVSEDPNFLPNPLLPDTRSEVAIPAIARGKVLGVFDVQHNVAGYFTQADLNVFLTLAGQIANALQSAALFSQAEAERDRAQRYLESAGSAIVVLNAQAEITLINQAGCEALGYTEQELLGQNWFELVVPPGLREDGKANFPKLIAGELPPRSEYIAPVTTKNGDERVMNWHDSVLWDEKGNIIGTLSSGDDITERLRTEEQAKTFQTLAETATDAILMADLETQQITYANRAAHTLFGCDYENREMVGTAGSQFWAEEDLPRLPQILEQAILEGWQGDVQQRRLDGSVFAANVTAFALQDTAQRSTHLVIMARDITERLQMEMEAREQAAQNRALLEAIPDMMFRFDKEGVFIDFKAESGQELLAPPEIFLGRHVAEVLPPNIANVTLEHLPHVLETGAPATYEYQAPMGDVLHHYEARLVRSGKDEVLGLVRDVTEQRKAETRVRESQQLLASFLNNFPDLAFAKNKQGTVILSNQVLEKTFPVEGGVLGKTVYDLVPPEFAEKIWTSEKAVIDTGETITIEELVPMDDGMHTKLTTKFPLYDSEGNATGLGGVSFDITDRKQAE
ncbi:MAG: PAS domain S-box protein, partial [Anaerolineae bacterium]|nr:PAS domain S-box protein [Anaerolineae bacterium]